MGIEPWKVMIGLSIVLVLIGAFAYLDITSPLQAVIYLVLLIGIFVAMYFGYRIGNALAERSD